MVGKVMNALKNTAFAENTLVVFSADNGPETHAFERLEEFKQWSSGKYRGVKRDATRGAPRALHRQMARQNQARLGFRRGGEPGRSGGELCQSSDTALKKRGYRQLRSATRPQGGEVRQTLRLATVQNTSPKKFALRQGDWVYINAPTGAAKRESSAYLDHFGLEAFGKGHEGLLFNLKEDPRQSDNLYAKYPERGKKMDELLQSYLDGRPCAPNKK